MPMKQKNKQTGGYARAASLTPERRSEIARNAVLKRWAIAGNKEVGKVPSNLNYPKENTNEIQENAVQAFQDATATDEENAN